MSLTRGGIGMLGLIALVILLSSSSNAPLFIVMSFYIALLLVNVPYARLGVRNLSVRREHASHVKEDSEICVNLRVTNRSRHTRVLLRLYDQGPAPARVAPLQIPILPGWRTQTLTHTCSAGKRGVYHFRTCIVESSSPFGLVRARKEIPAESELVVYPVYYELMGAMFPFHKTFSGMTAAPGSRPGEGPSFFGLREYRSGDPIRKIHWPTTLRTRTVMIKEFEEDMHASVTIVLDSCKSSIVTAGDDTNLEVAIRVAASLANYTLVNGHPTTLTYFDEMTRTIRGDKAMGELTPVLDALARLTPSDTSPAELINRASAQSAKNANCIVILLSADRNALSEILRLRSRGTEMLVVLVDNIGGRDRSANADWFIPMMDLFEGAGINVIMMTPYDDIQTTLSRNLKPPRRVRYTLCSS